MAKKDREFWESALLNNATFQDYYDRLVELSLAMFEWRNMPDEIDIRFLELTLFSRGKAVFFKDAEIDQYLALPYTNDNTLSVYNVPTNGRAYATSNGYQFDFTVGKSGILIWNNMLHKPAMRTVQMYARRLYNYDRIIDVNANAQKTPVLVKCDEAQRLTLLNLYKEFDGNAPVIFGHREINPNSLTVMKTDAPYIADKLQRLKSECWNEAMTYLGISNVNTEKRERMITDEITRSMGGVVASRYSRLESRRTACRQINKLYGLNIDCVYREDFQTVDTANDTTTGMDTGKEAKPNE